MFVYPEQKDIVLVGPAEGWKVDGRGNVVGVTTGRPVMLLDDLLVALRTARQAAQGGISCSIDPTPEGLARAAVGHAGKLTRSAIRQHGHGGHRAGAGPAEDHASPACRPTSHFARVLVAADYRMKRIAMNFEPSPVRGLPSFLQMMSAGGRGMSNMLPRWWLEPKYEPLLRDADGLAWELRGASVKAMTEEDFLDGQRQHAAHRQGQPDGPEMGRQHDRQVRRVGRGRADLRPVAELHGPGDRGRAGREGAPAREGRLQHADAAGVARTVKTDQFFAPKQVDSKASVLKKRAAWVISASGGVLINSWAIADKTRAERRPGPGPRQGRRRRKDKLVVELRAVPSQAQTGRMQP